MVVYVLLVSLLEIHLVDWLRIPLLKLELPISYVQPTAKTIHAETTVASEQSTYLTSASHTAYLSSFHQAD